MGGGKVKTRTGRRGDRVCFSQDLKEINKLINEKKERNSTIAQITS